MLKTSELPPVAPLPDTVQSAPASDGVIGGVRTAPLIATDSRSVPS